MILPGKPEWQPMLTYVAALHTTSTNQTVGYWDSVHQAMDLSTINPEQAADTLRHLLAGEPPSEINPLVWPLAVDMLGDEPLQQELAPRLLAQLDWFERNRRSADGIGFFYDDISQERHAQVDATAHLFAAYTAAARWTGEAQFAAEAEKLRNYIQTHLYDPETRWFHDDSESRKVALEGMWPMVVGAATGEQAWGVLMAFLNPTKFFSAHPIRSKSIAHNAMTLWVAGGCLQLGHPEAARPLLEAALDSTAHWFDVTGTIWELYDAEGGDPRKIHPMPEHLGNNPLLAMARLWEECQE